MSTSTDPSTLPKPFVFVLMPFDAAFHDIYKFGIKGAADDVGAYAERLDEQVFMEGILERIFNQISKADVVVADMTGRNPNVFYEVGYAHALGKIVLLLTQDADDIPFDLKHRQHIVYDGKIDTLRKELVPKLRWAIAESKRRESAGLQERFTIRLLGKEIKPGISPDNPVEISGTVTAKSFQLPIMLRNDSAETLSEITHIYLFTSKNAAIVPGKITANYTYSFEGGMTYGVSYPPSSTKAIPQRTPLHGFTATSLDAPDGLSYQYHLPINFPPLPFGATEERRIELMFDETATTCDELYRLRIHSSRQYHDFSFRLKIQFNEEEPPPDSKQES